MERHNWYSASAERSTCGVCEMTDESFVWRTIREYAPKLGIDCPVDLRIRRLRGSYGTCGLLLPSKYKMALGYKPKPEPYQRPYIELTLDHDLVCGKYGMDKLRDVIIHELIHGTGNHTHNKHFYETALSLGIELDHGSYEKFAACHR
jgi:hypothetical protein